MNLAETERETILAMCESDLNVSEAARRLFVHHNTIVYRLGCVRKKTGLNPQRYCDLKQLEEMAKR